MKPKISIITPSLNQGIYIEETITSIIGQNYSNLEYLIIDGESTDNTLEIIKKYESKITAWISQKENGQSGAINKGFSMSSGDILAWINSDDYYLPGALNFVADNMDLNIPQLLLGNSILIVEGSDIQWKSDIVHDHQKYNLEMVDYIMQPSCFINKKAWEISGPLNENLHFAFDWEYFIKCKHKGVSFNVTNKNLSIYRKHASHKSGAVSLKYERRKELVQIFEKYNSTEDLALLKKLENKTETLRQFEYYLKKLGLGYLYKIFATIRYPKVFAKYDFNKIESIIKMF